MNKIVPELLAAGVFLFLTGSVLMFWDEWLGKLLPENLKNLADRFASIGIVSLVIGAGLIMYSLR